MPRDILFLLAPDHVQSEGKFRYCPDCALVAGYLGFYPAVANAIDVRRVAPPRPRPEIVALLGEANQGAPVLVLAASSPTLPGIAVKEAQGRRFIDVPGDILAYLGQRYPGGLPL